MSEKKKVIKTTNSIFIENQQRMPESEISELVELERAQQEKAQQIEISSLDDDHVIDNKNVTENSSDENDENLNLINRIIIQISVHEKNNDDKLEFTTRSD